jgi:hypothetical protein
VTTGRPPPSPPGAALLPRNVELGGGGGGCERGGDGPRRPVRLPQITCTRFSPST